MHFPKRQPPYKSTQLCQSPITHRPESALNLMVAVLFCLLPFASNDRQPNGKHSSPADCFALSHNRTSLLRRGSGFIAVHRKRTNRTSCANRTLKLDQQPASQQRLRRTPPKLIVCKLWVSARFIRFDLESAGLALQHRAGDRLPHVPSRAAAQNLIRAKIVTNIWKQHQKANCKAKPCTVGPKRG